MTRSLLFLVCLALAGYNSWAQVTGSITGTVRDSTGALVPGVSITVKGSSLPGGSVITPTRDDGTYLVSLVSAGTYEIEVEFPGFTPQSKSGVQVAVHQQLILDFRLTVDPIAHRLEVVAKIPLMEVSRSDLNSRVSTSTIETLPLNGRNFTDLIALTPGAKPEPAGNQGTDISIFGERGAAISYLVDGADNNDPLSGGALQHFTQDSIQEFEVMTTGYEAEFGKAQGGVVNIITRTGGNNFSGSVFGFFRNDALDSSNVEGQDAPPLERRQWGGTLGGPLKTNRAFFFGALEVLDETRGVNLDQSRIPSFARSGLATATGDEDFSIGPETTGFTGMFRVDWTLTSSNQLHATFNRAQRKVSGEISSPIAGTIALPSAARTEDQESNSWTVRDTWSAGPRFFVETTAKYVDLDAGVNLERSQRLEPVLLLLRSGFLQTGAPFGGRRERDTNRLQMAQNLTWLGSDRGGDHQFKFGWDWVRTTVNGFNEVTNDVEYSSAFLASNQADVMEEEFQRLGFEQAAARFFTLSGNPDGSLDVDLRNHDFGLFFQDRWQVRQDFTLNLGLRWDRASLFGEDKDNIAPRLGFAWNPGARHKTVVRGGFGLFYDRTLLSAPATVPELGGVFTRSIFDVALPRLGFNYTDSLIDLVITSGFPTGESTRTPAENPAYAQFATDLRANPFSLYELLGIAVTDSTRPPVITADNIQQLSGLAPEQAIAVLESTYTGTDWGFFDVPGGSIVGDRVLSFFPRGPLGLTRDVSSFAEHRTPRTFAFNLGIDHHLRRNLVLAVHYVHRRSRDLLTRRIMNLFNVAPGDPNFGLTTDGGPRINRVTSEGEIDYDGIVVEVRKRFSHRYSFNFSYTGARARDNLLTGTVGSGFSNNHDPRLDWGPSNQSAPHIFSGHHYLALPGGFNFSLIAFWRSGNAFNPRGITDQDGDGLVDQRDTGFPRNEFRTDPFFDLDLRLEKLFRINDRHALSVLFEAFNVTNRANVANVNSVSGPDFGIPITFLPGREVQIGMRYRF